MRHAVNLDDMLAWMANQTRAYLTYASEVGPNKSKRLDVMLAGGYRVTKGDTTVYSGTDGKTAVDRYNEI